MCFWCGKTKIRSNSKDKLETTLVKMGNYALEIREKTFPALDTFMEKECDFCRICAKFMAQAWGEFRDLCFFLTAGFPQEKDIVHKQKRDFPCENYISFVDVHAWFISSE